jgi:hypothetical protein
MMIDVAAVAVVGAAARPPALAPLFFSKKRQLLHVSIMIAPRRDPAADHFSSYPPLVATAGSTIMNLICYFQLIL